MDTKTNGTCRHIGVCILHDGHSGICVFQSADGPPAVMPAGVAQIGEKDGQVVVDFGRTGPWQWVAFTPEQAVHFAEALIRQATRG